MKKKVLASIIAITLAAFAVGCQGKTNTGVNGMAGAAMNNVAASGQANPAPAPAGAQSVSTPAPTSAAKEVDPSIYTEEFCKEIYDGLMKNYISTDEIWYDYGVWTSDDDIVRIDYQVANIPDENGNFAVYKYAIANVVSPGDVGRYEFREDQTVSGGYNFSRAFVNEMGHNMILAGYDYDVEGTEEDIEYTRGSRYYFLGEYNEVLYVQDSQYYCGTDGGDYVYYNLYDAEGNAVISYKDGNLKIEGVDYEAMKKEAESFWDSKTHSLSPDYHPVESVGKVGDDTIQVMCYISQAFGPVAAVTLSVDGYDKINEKFGFSH